MYTVCENGVYREATQAEADELAARAAKALPETLSNRQVEELLKTLLQGTDKTTFAELRELALDFNKTVTDAAAASEIAARALTTAGSLTEEEVDALGDIYPADGKGKKG